MYINVTTKQTRASLPQRIAIAGGIIQNPSFPQCRAAGWRQIDGAIPEQTEGERTTGYVISDDNGTTCTVTRITEVDPYYVERQAFNAARDAFTAAVASNDLRAAVIELGKAVLSIAKVVNNEVEA